MFTTFIVQPIFNVLTLIYALIPGHNFGIAIILFTILARMALYPMLKKQLRHTKAMRELQPEIKKIKAQTKGNKQQESIMMMELYKEREIKPVAYMGLMVFQLVLFFALFSGLNRVVKNPQAIYDFSYPAIQNMSLMQELNQDISKFDNTLFGAIDLGRSAIDNETGFYFPAFMLVLGSALIQFFQIKQTMPSSKDSRKLKEILKDANTGKQADSTEISAAMTRNMAYILPFFIFVVTVGFPAALSLYWFVGGLVAYLQQSYLLKQDEYSMTNGTATATVVSKKPLRKKDSDVKVTVLSETIADTKPKASKTKSKSSGKNRNKRRK